ncbi:MAG: exonuclease domain-containing protein [Lachnospiraceae bacterium]|nr:exonuclease domain-containing protein [Lachnospiraceae bacterium]
MNKIFIDFEMNRVSKEYPDQRRICRFEIIQFGAVMLDGEDRETDSFNEYVRPAFSDVMDRRIEKLTGIHFEQLSGADPFQEVLRRFIAWCREDYEIYAWSGADLHQIRAELSMKKIAVREVEGLDYMIAHWHDYQKEFGKLFPFENAMSLSTAVSLAGLDFSGRAHDGLSDARSTASIYVMTKDPEKFAVFKKKVLDNLRPKAFTMGDLFDFSGMERGRH